MARNKSIGLTSDEINEELIICKICLLMYDEGPKLPLILNCQHFFCKSCTTDSLIKKEDPSRIYCPLCKTKTNLNKKGVSGLLVRADVVSIVRLLVRRRQMEQAEMEPGGYGVVPRQSGYNVWASNKEPGKVKGILKVRPTSQAGIGCANISAVGIPRQNQPTLHGKNIICSRCNNETEKLDSKKTTKQVEEHKIVVATMVPLHPSPNAFLGAPQELITANNPEPFPEEEQTKPALPEESIGINKDISIDQISLTVPLYGSAWNGAPPQYLKPLSENSDPENIVPDLNVSSFQQENGEINGSMNGGPVYPIGALLCMASAEGIPNDLLGSAKNIQFQLGAPAHDVTQEHLQKTGLTEMQKMIPSTARYVGRFGKYLDVERSQPGVFRSPSKIACSLERDTLAVIDPANSIIQFFSINGEYKSSLSVTDVTDAAFLFDNDLAVATTKGVQIYAPGGSFKKLIPIGNLIAVTRFKKGFVAAMMKRISVCTAISGSVIHSINGVKEEGLMKKSMPFGNVIDVAVGPKDELFVLESQYAMMINEHGILLSTINPQADSLCGPLENPIAVAICPKDSSIIVSDSGHRRVLQFGADGQFLRCLVNLQQSAQDEDVYGVAVDRTLKIFVIVKGKEMAEVRVYISPV